jgi:hypothetical protein
LIEAAAVAVLGVHGGEVLREEVPAAGLGGAPAGVQVDKRVSRQQAVAAAVAACQ